MKTIAIINVLVLSFCGPYFQSLGVTQELGSSQQRIEFERELKALSLSTTLYRPTVVRAKGSGKLFVSAQVILLNKSRFASINVHESDFDLEFSTIDGTRISSSGDFLISDPPTIPTLPISLHPSFCFGRLMSRELTWTDKHVYVQGVVRLGSATYRSTKVKL